MSASPDVLVVGCGPVGVMAALRARQRGLSVVAIDKTPEIYPLPRAIGMDDELQRLFESAGLLDVLRECSTPLPGADFVDASGERVVGFDLPPGTLGALGHPPMLMFDQPSLESGLRAAAEAAGVEFRFGLEAVAVDTTTPAVTVSSPDGESELTARWIIGADGARSTIRKLCGLTLIDQGFDEEWLVVDVTQLDPDVELPLIARQHCDPARVVTFVPGPRRHRRWEFRLNPGETADQVDRPEFIADLLSRWGTPEQLRIDRSAVYRFHATVADRFRCGGVFIAGDAAHQMPPFNGQGMCTGLRDAENLAWKLAMVADGTASNRLLDTYEIERQPHAAGQVQHAADAGRLINAIVAGWVSTTEAGYGGGRPFPHLEQGVLDGDHSAVGRPLPLPLGSAPFVELTENGWTLIGADDVDIAQLPMWSDVGARTLRVAASALPGLLADDAIVIVRPDGYVAAVTTELAATSERLAKLVGWPASAD
jgi:3-(3-hydroxy-phenyl)propionate hydroxylase